MHKIRKILAKYLLPIIFLLSIPAVRYLFVNGFFGVSDDLHIGWLFEMDRAVKMLQFPPRFVPDLSFGFGYPLFNFVYPLPFYIGEIIHLLGFSLINSVKIVFGLSIPFSIYFMYKLLKEYVPEELSLAGAVLYVYAPYRATEIFVRGTIGEIVAFVFLPLITLSVIKVTKEKSNKWVGVMAFSIALLIMSHNIMAYMYTPFAILLFILQVIFVAKSKKTALLQGLIGIGLGLAISMYFWLPAILESGLMQYSTVFSYFDHFPTLKQLITPYFGYGASVPGPYDGMSFYIGLTGIIVAVLGFVLFVYKFNKFTKPEKVFYIWSLIILAISIFMMNYRSSFLWDNLPLLPYFQFPWRFLALVTFSIPILLLSFNKFSRIGTISILVIAAAIILNFNYFKTSEYLGRQDDYYLNRYVPFPVASEEYKKTGEEYLRLPIATTQRPTENYPLAYTSVSAISAIEEVSPLKSVITTDYPENINLNYSKYYFPGWYAKVDGQNAPITPGSPFGQITLEVPAGSHTIEVGYKESKLRLIFDLISLSAIVTTFVICFKKKRK